MKKRDIYLTAILLLLIGVTLGTLLTFYIVNGEYAPLSEVKYTEITKSDSTFINEHRLGDIDSRFLFKSVAEKVIPSVVYIETVVPIEHPRPVGKDSEYNDDVWERIMPRKARTVGSGVIMTKDGYILTNYHVIEGAVKRGIKVILNDKREYPARVVGYDPSTDLAVIKIKAENLPAVIVGNSESLNVGDWVMAIGNPFRLRSTVTAGIVSALGRDVQIIHDNYRIESFIQTDAAINKGNSGGALVNTSAQLVGINTAIASQSGAYQGYGFAVPSNLALKVATDIIEFGEVKRALLGVTISSIDYSRARKLGMSEVRGVEIVSISEQGSAYKSGLRSEDVVLTVNGASVNESNQLQEKVAVLRPGDTVDLEVFRKGKILRKQILLSELSQDDRELLSFNDGPLNLDEIPEDNFFGVKSFRFDLGFRVLELPHPDDEKNRILLVADVSKNSEAWNRGLRMNQTIVAVNNAKVEDIGTLRELIQNKLETDGTLTLEIKNAENARGFIRLSKTK